MTWQEMKSAPRDGTVVEVLGCHGAICRAQWLLIETGIFRGWFTSTGTPAGTVYEAVGEPVAWRPIATTTRSAL
jgi:hypothetical protein